MEEINRKIEIFSQCEEQFGGRDSERVRLYPSYGEIYLRDEKDAALLSCSGSKISLTRRRIPIAGQ
jgi:hypothetical protein